MLTKRFAASLTLGVILLAGTTNARAEEDWFLSWMDGGRAADVLAAPRIIVAERMEGADVETADTGNPTFPARTYYAYRIWVQPDGGGKPFWAVGHFKSLTGVHGMYAETTNPVDLTVTMPPPIIFSFDTVAFTSFRPNEEP